MRCDDYRGVAWEIIWSIVRTAVEGVRGGATTRRTFTGGERSKGGITSVGNYTLRRERQESVRERSEGLLSWSYRSRSVPVPKTPSKIYIYYVPKSGLLTGLLTVGPRVGVRHLGLDDEVKAKDDGRSRSFRGQRKTFIRSVKLSNGVFGEGLEGRGFERVGWMSRKRCFVGITRNFYVVKRDSKSNGNLIWIKEWSRSQ